MTDKGLVYAHGSLRSKLKAASSLEVAARLLSEYIQQSINVGEVSVCFIFGELQQFSSSTAAGTAPRINQSNNSSLQLAEHDICWGKTKLELPLAISDVDQSDLPIELIELAHTQGVLSLAAVPICLGTVTVGFVECRCRQEYHRWREYEIVLIESAAELFGIWLEGRRQTEQNLQSSEVDDRARFAKQGNLLFVETDENYRITNVVGASETILGLSHDDLKSGTDVWRRIIHPQELRPLIKKMRKGHFSSREVSEEVRVVHQRTKEVRWVAVRGVGHVAKGPFGGRWEGFIFDVTDRRNAQDELENQGRRIRALYEVSSSLQVNMDPALVTLRGLRAIIQATKSDCGYAVLYDANSGKMEVVAAEGLSQTYLDKLLSLIDGRTLLRHVVESRQGILIPNIQEEPRAAIDLAMVDGLCSAIMMPLVFEDQILGAIVIFCKRANRFTSADLDLVQAAGNQIGLVARQAEYYSAERREASSFAALYRLTHQISKFLTPKEIAEQSFPIISAEVPTKRMWLGVLNEQGTHIVGQCGVGPGVRRHIVDMQIELELRHDFLDEALKTRRPVIVKSDQEMECSGFNRILKKLEIGTFLIVPLVSLGQVVGVLLLEPSSPSVFFAQRKLPLLTSMASEIAAVILARRFEAKMADADKMRMAGLLASGVAHNFNNLLQAVMGQASLIEMQVPEGSQLGSSARTIVESAGRGAALIRQLLNFTVQASAERAELSINKFLEDSRELYLSVLGSDVALEFKLAEGGRVLADTSQIQQIITNLLLNAKEAMNGKEDSVVKIITSQVRLRSGEIDPELSPGQYVRIDIVDNGVGMDKERLARCFEPFFTTKNVDNRTGLGLTGSGLGLSSAYSIARSHGGVISARSEPGEGATFSLFLPIAVTRTRALSLSESEIAAVQGQAHSQILLLDIDETLQVSVRAISEAMKLQVKLVSNRESLVETLKASGLRTKAVVIDLDRANYDVPKLLSSIRGMSSRIGVLGATADRKRWTATFSVTPSAIILDKPQSAWAIREALRTLAANRPGAAKIEKEITTGGRSSKAELELDDDSVDPAFYWEWD